MGAPSSGHQPARALAHVESLGSATEKKSLTAVERHRPETERARRRFQTKLSRVPSNDLVFIDESGARTDLTRRYGRAPKGERVREAVPHGRWKGLTLLGALSTKGVQASRTMEAATDADVFLTFVQQVLVPRCVPVRLWSWTTCRPINQERSVACSRLTSAVCGICHPSPRI